MSTLILTINPGSTSTKIGLFDGREEVFRENISHSDEELARFRSLYDQREFRLGLVVETMKKHGVKPEQLSVVMGRGGMLPPVKSGGYVVDETMKQLILEDRIPRHASNLGALLAADVAEPAGVPAYIYDAVSVDEFPEVAKITGFPEIVRHSFCHVLNSKAVARRVAAEMGGTYEDMNFLVAHLGGGISVSAHRRGRIVDSLSDDNGPFSPERAGNVPILDVIDMCYSGSFTKAEMKKKVRGFGGMKAYLGTADCREIEAMIQSGDERAALIYEAQSYQIAKGLALVSPALMGKVDAVILTGGVAHSKMMTDKVARQSGYLGPVRVVAGEFELEALAEGGLRILKGEEKVHTLAEDIVK